MSANSKSTPLKLTPTVTSNWISRLFWFGAASGGIQKMRSKFFGRSKSSGVPVTQPAGCGGECFNQKRTYHLIKRQLLEL